MTKMTLSAFEQTITANGSNDLDSANPTGAGAGASSFPYDSARSIAASPKYVAASGGSDGNDGAIGTPWATVNYALQQLVAGETLYLRGGTHTVTPLVMKSVGNTGTVGNIIEVTSYPGEEPIIDCNGGGWLGFENKAYWKFSHLSLLDWATSPNPINGAWWLGEDIAPTNCEWFSIEGSTQYGGDNVGMISRKHGTSLTFDKIKVTLTVAPATIHQNTGGLYLTNLDDSTNNDITINRVEVYNFPKDIYFKHGDRTGITSNLADIQVNNSFLQGATVTSCGYNQSGVKFNNCIFTTDLKMSEADGGEGGDWNWYDHCTFNAEALLREQVQGPLTGAQNNKFTNSILTTLTIEAGSSSVTSDSNYNLFVNNITDKGTSRDLASWRTANSSDANSVQGTPTYVGSDFDTIAAYSLDTGSTGENASSTSTDIGANVTLIGVLA